MASDPKKVEDIQTLKFPTNILKLTHTENDYLHGLIHTKAI